MPNEMHAPNTLLEAVRYFAAPDASLQFVAALRWPDGVTCPVCEGRDVSFLSTRRIWKCKGCKKQFSVKLGTIFEDSPIGLDKWLPALWMLANCKNGISSYELARALGVTQKTGWFMLHRIRLAMQTGTFKKLSGEVEADETFIGGKARNMHVGKRRERIKNRGGIGKPIVMGLLERHGDVRTFVVEKNDGKTLKPKVRQHVEKGAELFTDALGAYYGLDREYVHQVIDHAEAYVRGNVHTNGLENFWSLLKRGIKGTYVAVEPFHLFRYLDEQARRFNEREHTDGQRFVSVVRDIVGRRVTYRDLTGADLAPATT
ncbi:MAG: IS1595 family transposase [Gemmatimonadaceae bacterium]